MRIATFKADNETWDSYHVSIEKNGKDFKSIQYSNMNGHAMGDMLKLLRKKYTKEKGYKIKLI